MNKIVKSLIWIVSLGNNVKIARKLGTRIGKNCRIIGNVFHILGSEPELIEIGNHVSISSGTRFLNHHGELWVLRSKEKNIQRFEKIIIGNNVFIGQNVIILPGVTIGNDVVIGAGSIVTHNIPDNVVYAGCPARFICDFDDFSQKQLQKPYSIINSKKERKIEITKVRNS